MIKVDVHGHEQRYKNWKELAIVTDKHGNASIRKGYIEDGLTKNNSDILIRHILDMEAGVNISKKSKKGGRSYPRLNNIRQRLSQMMRMLQKRGVNDVSKLTERQITDLFNDMRKGIIKTIKGGRYQSVADYAKIFQAFWRWWIKYNRKEGKEISDITEDLDTSSHEPKFVSIAKEELEKMLPYFSQDEQVILLFVFDSIIRAPTELMSLKVKDVFERRGEMWVNIPKEISKTIGRTLNLIYSGNAVRDYIKRNNLQPDDYLFSFSYPMLTEKMQKVAMQLFKDSISEGGEYYKNITLYDLRHSGAIHLRVIAHKTKKVNLDALRQRGGWTDFKMLNYYTKFLGLTGEIDSNDLLIEEDKSKLEREMDELKRENKKTLAMLTNLHSISNIMLKAAVKDKRTGASLKKQFKEALAEKGPSYFLSAK